MSTKLAQVLENWSSLDENLMLLSEEELEQLISIEKEGQRRASFLGRMHARVRRLRTAREREELMKMSQQK